MFRTSNPAFRQDAFAPAQTWDDLRSQGRIDQVPGAELSPESAAVASARAEAAARARPDHMTIAGVVHRTWFLLAICVITSVFAWNITTAAEPLVSPIVLLLGGAIGGLITGLICSFAPRTAPFTAPIYALFEGALLGSLSAFYAMRFARPEIDAATGVAAEGSPVALNTGLVMNAALLTFGILGGLLLGYSTGVIRPGPWFRKAVVTATFGVVVYIGIAVIAGLFGSFSLLSVYDPSNGGLISIGFSLLLVGIASANFVLDFEFVENGVRNKAPRYYEWYAGFGILVTMIWLYVELLRLLSKLQSRD
jgi:uncharacterized YccA/Bax inhibitor family protein